MSKFCITENITQVVSTIIDADTNEQAFDIYLENCVNRCAIISKDEDIKVSFKDYSEFGEIKEINI